MWNPLNNIIMKKILFILMLFFTMFTTVSAQSVQEKPQEKVYEVIEDMPNFPGGQGELMKYLRNNIKYPAEAQKKKIEGRVIVTFVVDKKGRVVNPMVERSVHPLLDAEALRVIKRMPKWKAGKVNGEPVNVKYRLPITFKL